MALGTKPVIVLLTVAKLLSGINGNIECNNATTHYRHDQVTIECTSDQSFESAKWYYKEDYVDDLETEISGSTATLVFDPADVTTRTGEYRCTLLNEDGDVVNSDHAYLNAGPVPYKLRLLSVDGNHTYHQQSVTARERSSASILCTVNSFPDATIQWFRDGMPIENLTDYDRYGIETKHQLDISNVKMQDRTTFSCIASNFVGNCTIFTLVRVRSWLAPVWPAIGIAIELSILGAYILFNRRAKQREAKLAGASSINTGQTEDRNEPGTSGLSSVVRRMKASDDN